MIIEEFWRPLAERMTRYSELNELDKSASSESYEPMRERIKSEQYQVMILEENGPKAYMMLEEEISITRKKGRCVRIVDLFVKEGFRGKGLELLL